MLPELLKFNAPVPDPSIVPPLVLNVNNRLQDCISPVYLSVPPLNTRFEALLEEAPMLLLLPPLLRVLMEITPALMVTGPVKVFDPPKINVPVPYFESPGVPVITVFIVAVLFGLTKTPDLVVKFSDVPPFMVYPSFRKAILSTF
jgi:hypothetical protein